LQSLSKPELDRLEVNALQQADVVVRAGYDRSRKGGGAAYTAYRQMLLEREVSRILDVATLCKSDS
jgi:hypothetical protein